MKDKKQNPGLSKPKNVDLKVKNEIKFEGKFGSIASAPKPKPQNQTTKEN